MPKDIKTARAEMRERIDIVMSLILKGLHRREIYEYTRKKTDWDITIKTVDLYIKKVNDILDKEMPARREREITKATKRYESLMAKSEMIQDYRSAAKIQRYLCDLLGLNAPTNIKMDAQVRGVLSIKELKESVAKKPEEE